MLSFTLSFYQFGWFWYKMKRSHILLSVFLYCFFFLKRDVVSFTWANIENQNPASLSDDIGSTDEKSTSPQLIDQQYKKYLEFGGYYPLYVRTYATFYISRDFDIWTLDGSKDRGSHKWVRKEPQANKAEYIRQRNAINWNLLLWRFMSCNKPGWTQNMLRYLFIHWNLS